MLLRISRGSLSKEGVRASSLQPSGSRPEMRSSAKRTGSGSNSAAAAVPRRMMEAGARAERSGRRFLLFLALARKKTAPLWFIQRTTQRGRLARSRLERCSGSVSRKSANSLVAGPSAIPGAGSSLFRGLTPARGESLLRRPLPHCLPGAKRTDKTEHPSASVAPPVPNTWRAVLRAASPAAPSARTRR